MPIYEYRCRDCGVVSEFLVGMGYDQEISCPSCESLAMEKLMSTASFMGVETARAPGRTCCGREERCETSPCEAGKGCRRI